MKTIYLVFKPYFSRGANVPTKVTVQAVMNGAPIEGCPADMQQIEDDVYSALYTLRNRAFASAAKAAGFGALHSYQVGALQEGAYLIEEGSVFVLPFLFHEDISVFVPK